MNLLERVAGLIRRHWLKVAAAVALLLLLSLIFGTSVKEIFFLLLFITLGSFSTFYFNYIRPPIKFELIKLFTILTAVAYGIVPALVVGITSVITGKVLISRIDERLINSLIFITIVAIAASIFITPENIVLGGLILVGIYNIGVFTLSMVMGGDLMWNLPYEGSDFIINYVLFTGLAAFLLSLL